MIHQWMLFHICLHQHSLYLKWLILLDIVTLIVQAINISLFNILLWMLCKFNIHLKGYNNEFQERTDKLVKFEMQNLAFMDKKHHPYFLTFNFLSYSNISSCMCKFMLNFTLNQTSWPCHLTHYLPTCITNVENGKEIIWYGPTVYVYGTD